MDNQQYTSRTNSVDSWPGMLNNTSHNLEPTTSMTHLSYLQQQHSQQQFINNHHSYRQMSPDTPLGRTYSQTFGNMAARNITNQNISGTSPSYRSGLDLENGWGGMPYQAAQPCQRLQLHNQDSPQHGYSQPPQVAAQPCQRPQLHDQRPQLHNQDSPQHGYNQPPQVAAQSQLLSSSHHQNMQDVQQVQKQILQPQHSTSQQQNFYIQQSLLQRRLRQQHLHQAEEQPKPIKILQKPVEISKTGLGDMQQAPHVASPQTQLNMKATNGQLAPEDNSSIKADETLPQDKKATSCKAVVVPHQSDSVCENLTASLGKKATSSNAVLTTVGAAHQSDSNVCEKNMKQKTPLCLINELAHFNKLHHQYVLVDEQGPAHKKTFQVKLRLAEEEYSASGDSIKKAQNAAAAVALKETKYSHPPPKVVRFGAGNTGKTTLDLELSSLAMKRGEVVTYKAIERRLSPFYHQPGIGYTGGFNTRHQHVHMNRYPHYQVSDGSPRHQYLHTSRLFYGCLTVGRRQFIGDGLTCQEACHNATQKALHCLKNLPAHDSTEKGQTQIDEVIDDLKSEISSVYETALHRNLSLKFEVIHEAGLPHMKSFITRCTVGDLVTEGSGNSKKTSKKKAAELMLEELKKLPPAFVPALSRPKTLFHSNKKKNRHLVKSELQQQKADPNYGVDMNPISRLIQIMQAKKRKEPVYTLVSETGLTKREFVVQVDLEGKTCTGTGPNKKLAKRYAAEAMLQLLGYTKPSPQPAKSSLKHSISLEGSQSGDKKVTFVDGDKKTDDLTSSTSSHQITQQRVPGLLRLPTSATKTALSPRASSSHPKDSQTCVLKPSLRAEEQLQQQLCQVLNYSLDISDSSQKHMEGTKHITQITVGGEQEDIHKLFHGSSDSGECSRDMAVQNLLAEIKGVHVCGDGPQMKESVTKSNDSLQEDISI